MLKTWARMPLFLLLVAAIRLGLPGSAGLDAAPSTQAAGSRPVPGTVYVTRGLPPDGLAVLSAAIAGRDPSGILLIDTPVAAPANRAFLAAIQPPRIVPVGNFTEDVDQLEKHLGFRPEAPYQWTARPPRALWRDFYPRADAAVVCPAEPRGLLLQGACLAGTLGAPLYVRHGHDFESNDLQSLLLRWQTRDVFVLGPDPLPFELPGLRITHLANEHDAAHAHRRHLARKTTVRNLVVANPYDIDIAEHKARVANKDDPPHVPHSPLAAWIALRRHAALVLTQREGGGVDELVAEAVRSRELRHADTLILVADLGAVPVHKRPNPVKGDKDEHIEMEPLTPGAREPFSFSVGRLFHDDPGLVPLMVAREHLLKPRTGPHRALIASNAGDGLPLLETISRHTARELQNAGFETTALFGKNVTQETLRGAMPKHDLFVWEGHHNLLIKDWKFASWDEPLPPSLVFLQSCLVLKEWKVGQLFPRGAVGVIGSSTRTYSASGGAASLSFLDAMLHDDLSVGASLRQSKNFLLAYTMLKEKRMGDDAKKPGASLRAAWAFTLWGDPTLKLPVPARPTTAAPPVRHSVRSNVLTLHLPVEKLDAVHSDKYHTHGHANARLAGLVGKEKGEDGQGLLPMVFVEVPLPKAPEGKTPRLSSKLPSRSWVFNWDARLRRGYLLAVPRAKDTEELRFVIHWEEATTSAR